MNGIKIALLIFFLYGTLHGVEEKLEKYIAQIMPGKNFCIKFPKYIMGPANEYNTVMYDPGKFGVPFVQNIAANQRQSSTYPPMTEEGTLTIQSKNLCIVYRLVIATMAKTDKFFVQK